MLSLSNFCKLKFNCFTFSNSSENIAILCTLLSKAIRFLPVNFLFDSKTLIVLLESLFSSLSVDFNWNDCNWEFKISIYLKSGYLFFALENTLKKELVIENVRAICCIVPKNFYSFWIKLFFGVLGSSLLVFGALWKRNPDKPLWLLTDFVCLYNDEFLLSLCKIVRSSVILLLPLFTSF